MPLCADDLTRKGESMAYDGTLKFDTSVVTDGFKSGVSKLGSIAKTGLAAATAAIGAVSTALTAAGGYAVKVGSDFEAGMSQVAAISGAAGKDLEALTEKAKEMGAKTKFSATESAEAFNYMAMAGWKTGDMLNGIEGIMDLAAASGEDLAMVSDIVTDALTAFGMEAKDSGHFADVLAAAASNSNTNVGKMGYTFKYVAPIAGAMKYSIEDTAVAIGLMANAGIKGEQAGTSLRGMLTRLVKPTDAVAGAMEELGICMTNADGSMRPLNDVIGDLRASFSKLSDSEKTYYAATIAGQEAMSGMLAIVNASEGDFNKLTAAINGADGAAKTTAETMQDNLKGAIEELSGSAETLGLEIYEGLQIPLKEAALKGVEYVNQITEAFESGGLEAAVMEAGNIFGELAVKAAEQAPKMIDAAVNFIQSFIQGIAKNAPKLIDAAKRIVSALVDGLVRLLPSEIQKPVKETVEILKKSFRDGGLKSAINTVANIVKNLGKVLTNVAKVILPPLAKAVDLVGKNLKLILPLVTSAAIAWKTWSVLQSVSAWMKGMKAATAAVAAATAAEASATAASTAALTLKQVALGALTGKISLATAAQWLWNAAMNANPIGIVITAVAALATGIGLLCMAMDQQETAAERINAANESLAESFSEIGQEAATFRDGINTAESYLSDFGDALFATSEEQQALQDNMREVQNGITEICKRYSDNRKDYTAQEIQQLDEYFQKLRELYDQQLEVEALRAQAVSQQAITAAENFSGTLDEYEELSQRWIATTQEQADNQIKIIEEQSINEIALLNQRYGDQANMSNDAYAEEYNKIIARKEEKLTAVKEEVGLVTSAYQEGYTKQSESLSDYLTHLVDMQTSEEYERKRHQSKIDEYNARMQAGEIGMRENIELENYRHEQNMAGIREQYEKGLDDEVKHQLGAWLAMVDNTIEHGGDLTLENEKFVAAFLKAYDSMPNEMKETMDQGMAGMVNSIKSNASNVIFQAAKVGKNVLNELNKVLEVHSPSRATYRIFKHVMKGAENSLVDESPELYKQADKTATGFLKRFSPKLDVSAMVAKMKAAVAAQHSAIAPAAEASAFAFTQASKISANAGQADNDGAYVAEVRVDLEGREIARATAPFMGSQLAFAGGI